MSFEIVIPTAGRESLAALLGALAAGSGPAPERVLLVDDRRRRGGPLVRDAPLDVFVVRKLGVPGREELAMGAIASGGIRVIDPEIVSALGISPVEIELVARREEQELVRREELYRGDRPPPELKDRTAILVDDGLATGSSMRAAALAVRSGEPAKVVVAVPTAPAETCAALRREADDVVCSMTPEPFQAVGLWYDDFTETTDDEIRRLLDEARTQP